MPELLLCSRPYTPCYLELRTFVAHASHDEFAALFNNPTVSLAVLELLFKREVPFDELGDDQWTELVQMVVGNEQLSKDPNAEHGGYIGFLRCRALSEAWGLARRVPTTPEWASRLIHLLEPIRYGLDSIEDKHSVIDRWRLDPRQQMPFSTTNLSLESPKDGYLDTFGCLRVILAQSLTLDEINALRGSEDVAMRCAYYRFGALSVNELGSAYQREPRLLLRHALCNDSIWERPDTRSALRELCWKEPSDEMDDFDEDFTAREDRLKDQYPISLLSKINPRSLNPARLHG